MNYELPLTKALWQWKEIAKTKTCAKFKVPINTKHMTKQKT